MTWFEFIQSCFGFSIPELSLPVYWYAYVLAYFGFNGWCTWFLCYVLRGEVDTWEDSSLYVGSLLFFFALPMMVIGVTVSVVYDVYCRIELFFLGIFLKIKYKYFSWQLSRCDHEEWMAKFKEYYG